MAALQEYHISFTLWTWWETEIITGGTLRKVHYTLVITIKETKETYWYTCSFYNRTEE